MRGWPLLLPGGRYAACGAPILTRKEPSLRVSLRAAGPVRLGLYELMGRLGAGGMGTVCRSRPRRVAVVALLCVAEISWALIDSKPTANRKAFLTASPTPAADQQLSGTAAQLRHRRRPAAARHSKVLRAACQWPPHPAAMVELVSQLLPDRKISHARAIGDALSIQLYLDAGDGLGLIGIEIDGPPPAKPPKVDVDNLPNNCLQSTLVSEPGRMARSCCLPTQPAWPGTARRTNGPRSR